MAHECDTSNEQGESRDQPLTTEATAGGREGERGVSDGAKRVSHGATAGRARRSSARKSGEDARVVEAARAKQSDEAVARAELAEQGFSVEETQRIIDVTERLANSREARESEQTLRRLRFTQWLVAHGVLDEFSA